MKRVLAVVLFVLSWVPGCGSGPVDVEPDSSVAADGGGNDVGTDDQGGGPDAETPDDVGVDAGPEADQGTDSGLAQLGTSCTAGAECDSGFCADGVCCDGACDGACEQCGSGGACFLTGGAGGIVECRPSGGTCDVAEFCSGTDADCPDDDFVTGGTACLPFACSGDAPACPTTCANQSECGAGTLCVAGDCIDARIVFVSSVAVNGNTGGIAGADLVCQALASQAGLPGTFHAWLSLTTNHASSRIAHATVPYVMLVDGMPGTKVADDWTDFTDGTLDAAIIRTETGELVTQDFAWTNTQPSGNAPHDVVSCQGWTSGDSGQIGIVGMTTAVDSSWAFALNRGCDAMHSLYCVQD